MLVSVSGFIVSDVNLHNKRAEGIYVRIQNSFTAFLVEPCFLRNILERGLSSKKRSRLNMFSPNNQKHIEYKRYFANIKVTRGL